MLNIARANISTSLTPGAHRLGMTLGNSFSDLARKLEKARSKHERSSVLREGARRLSSSKTCSEALKQMKPADYKSATSAGMSLPLYRAFMPDGTKFSAEALEMLADQGAAVGEAGVTGAAEVSGADAVAGGAVAAAGAISTLPPAMVVGIIVVIVLVIIIVINHVFGHPFW